MDYHQIINSIKKKGKSLEVENEFSSTENQFAELVMTQMNSSKSRTDPFANATLFSEFFGEEMSDGLVADFKRKKLRFDPIKKQLFNQLGYSELKEEVGSIMREFHTQLVAKNKWLGLMGLMERLLLQMDCYSNPKILCSAQKQRSGQNQFHYILLRAPFYDLVEGRNEIRVYFNKLEDYPQFKSIEELQNDNNFKADATKEVRKKMKEIIDANPITFSEIQDAFKKIESDEDREEITAHEKMRLDFISKYKQ